MLTKIYIILLLLTGLLDDTSAANFPIEGRFSFSLSTFNPSGRIDQISYASKAASLGPPIVAFTLPKSSSNDGDGILLVSPQFLPSPLIKDDGTSRFVKVTNSIVVGHTGVNADGRVLTAAALRLAVEHAYTFEEEIPIAVLLEEMALLYQEYTMKPASRPFGCSLLVASIGNTNDIDDSDGQETAGGGNMYRIDPSGCVTELDSMAYLGRGDGDKILQRLKEEVSSVGYDGIKNFDDAEQIILKIIGEEMGLIGEEKDGIHPTNIICTRLSREKGCMTRRIPLR